MLDCHQEILVEAVRILVRILLPQRLLILEAFPLVDGIVIDEANGGDLKVYDYLAEAVQRMEQQQPFKKKKRLYLSLFLK